MSWDVNGGLVKVSAKDVVQSKPYSASQNITRAPRKRLRALSQRTYPPSAQTTCNTNADLLSDER
jgi:hypothetical protein